MNYSPPFQAAFPYPSPSPSFSFFSSSSSTSSTTASNLQYATADFNAYHAAIVHYASLLQHPASLHEIRMNEGDCVIFDNRRVLHARRAFDASKGERWLKGAYVDDDVFFSRVRVLEDRFGRGNSGKVRKVEGEMGGEDACWGSVKSLLLG
jgi:hypothetical protein